MTTQISQHLPNIENLPDVFAISLDQYGAITLSGEEQSKYLQGQVTCDVNTMTENTLLHGAHCDAKGKVFSAFRLINRNGAHFLLQPEQSISASLSELKKFGVFAKVEIAQERELAFIAIAGEKATETLHESYEELPNSLTPVLQQGNTTIVYLSGESTRYLFIDSKENLTKITNKLALTVYSQQVWNLIETIEGFPLLSESSCAEYVPQMLNLQAIHGISFTKGCYLGQETVARMQYLGKNKRALFALKGSTDALKPGDIIEKQLGENWRKAGDVLVSYHSEQNVSYVQAVLANDVDSKTALRIKNQEKSQLEIVELPYHIE